MGCCFSKEEDNLDDVNEVNRPLLDPIVDGPSARPTGTRYNSIDQHPQPKGDEQSALNKILQDTATNVIDVAALDAHGIDPAEHMYRAKQYSQRLTSWCTTSQPYRSLPPLPLGVAAPQALLSSQPVSASDIQLITTATQQAVKSLADIKVRHKEELVVPFGVP